MRILITGAAGDFGRDLAPWLAAHHDVRVTDARPVETDLEFVQADLCDRDSLTGLCDDVETVIHLAALLPKDQYRTNAYFEANAAAVALLAEEALRADVRRLIYISTVWATGHGIEEGTFMINEATPPTPVCMYGLTKYLGEVTAEYYSRKHKLSVTVLRACGYLRHPDFDATGQADWPTADLASIAGRFTNPAAKLFNPADLGHLLENALRRPQTGFERFLVGLSLPFTAADAELCRHEPVAAWDKYYPGAADCFAGLGFEPPSFTHTYDNRRSRDELGFAMRYTLQDVINEWQRRQSQ
ncbi:MAG: NAD(P)-dependent oxidoreductase [Armatimonadia bacterium]